MVSSMKPAVLGQHFRESRGGISLKINHTTTKIVEGVNENSVQTSGLGQLQSSFSGCSDSFSSHGPFYDFSFILCLQPLWILNPVTIGAFLVPGPYDPHGTVSEIKVIATYTVRSSTTKALVVVTSDLQSLAATPYLLQMSLQPVCHLKTQ